MDCLLGFRKKSVTQPEDCLYNAQVAGNYEVVNQYHIWVWDLPLGASLDAEEESVLARFKHNYSLIGIVVVPLFLKPEWLRGYVKNVDLYLLYQLVQLLNGPLPCMKVLKLVSISLFSGIACGNSPTSYYWVNWESCYQRCNAMMQQGQGIFYVNFGAPVLGFPLCHKSRCADFYSQRCGTSFLVYTRSNPTTAPKYVEEYGYFTSARPGDSLFCTFECD